MKKSKLATNPRRIAGQRLRTKFNCFPHDATSGRFVVITRVPNPEASRVSLAVTAGTVVEGWFELNTELMALYRNGEAMILFDRFINSLDEHDTIISVVAANESEVERAMNVLLPQSSDDWEQLLLEFGDD